MGVKIKYFLILNRILEENLDITDWIHTGTLKDTIVINFFKFDFQRVKYRESRQTNNTKLKNDQMFIIFVI